MGLYALSGGLEADRRLRTVAKNFMVVDINRRKDYVKTLMLSGKSDAVSDQGCQMAKFDPFLSLDCARVEGVGAQSKERKGSNFAA